MIPNLITADQVLYLDCDLVVNDRLDELFKFKLDGPLAAVPDFKDPSQFNSGVLLINNKFWREKQLSSQLLDLSKKPELADSDQTVINQFFKGKIKELPPTYNYQISYEKKAYWNDIDSTFAFLDQVRKPKSSIILVMINRLTLFQLQKCV